MAKHGQFFSESDPEWAVARLAAHAAEVEVQPVRRVGWRRAVGAALVVLAATVAFLAGLRHEPVTTPTKATNAKVTSPPSTLPSPDTRTRAVAPQVTLAAVSTPSLVPVATASPRVTPSATPTAQPQPRPPAKAPVRKPTPKPVGPNTPIATPIDPDAP